MKRELAELTIIQCFECAGTRVAGLWRHCHKCGGTGKVIWVSGRAYPYTSEGERMARKRMEREASGH